MVSTLRRGTRWDSVERNLDHIEPASVLRCGGAWRGGCPGDAPAIDLQGASRRDRRIASSCAFIALLQRLLESNTRSFPMTLERKSHHLDEFDALDFELHVAGNAGRLGSVGAPDKQRAVA